MGFFRVAALDLDGTLTSHGALSPAALEAVDRARADGLVVLLVTGRIGSELEAEFPGLAEHFDALVLENGAVAVAGGAVRPLAAPVDPALAERLTEQGVPCRRGEVLLAVDGDLTGEVADAIAELGLDCQLVHNRAAAMVLPAGVTKGTGLVAVLSEMNLSPHNTIAVGDAENDLSLLRAAEVGVAVGNAVRSVRQHADVVLEGEDGADVARLLTGPYLTGGRRLCPTRRWIDVGAYDDGAPVLVPGSQARILVTGASGAGKSYLVGLMAERWVLAGYSVLVVDPEGDHVALAELSNVRIVDAGEYLPPPVDLMGAMLHPGGSVVLDLSGMVEAEKVRYLRRLRAVTRTQSEAHGVPHWVVFDEAHLRGNRDLEHEPVWTPRGGYVLASFMPGLIATSTLECADVVLRMEDGDSTLGTVAAPARRATIRFGSGPTRVFAVGARRTRHVRHRHKYADVQLPQARRFYFRTEGAEPVVAGTLQEFRAAVRHVDPAVLEFHLERGDLSRWLGDTIADRDLATCVAALEGDLAARRAADIERVRQQIVAAVGSRYLEELPPPTG